MDASLRQDFFQASVAVRAVDADTVRKKCAQARAEMLARFGFGAFLPMQERVLEDIFHGRDLLAVLPTGGGKSLLFQLPPLVDGALMVVISPLIALMREQVGRLQAAGIAAGALHFANDGADEANIYDQLRIRRLRIVYLSPERFLKPGMQALLARAKPRYIAVDEAHCIAHWGHDFRPDYLRLKEAIRALSIPQTLAFTATADSDTRAQIIAHLFDTDPTVRVASFARPNIFLRVKRSRAPLAQIAMALKPHQGACGIIYCNTRARTEELARALCHLGFPALAYHAGMPYAVRARVQEKFLSARAIIMVATIAFGMGIDRPDVRFVFHADMPASLETFYQEVGRAGRDGKPAHSLLLYDRNALVFQQARLAEQSGGGADFLHAQKRLAAVAAYCAARVCRRQVVLRAFGEESAPCNHCDRCLARKPWLVLKNLGARA